MTAQPAGRGRGKALLAPSGLLVNVSALYAIQGLAYGSPLLLIPYLTRVLGIVEWGYVALFQSMAALLAIVVDFGFGYSATREVAGFGPFAERRARYLAEVLSAKLMLCLVAGLLSLALFLFVPALGAGATNRARYFVGAVVMACGLSLNITWYYQGLGTLRTAALFELAGKLASFCLTILVVRSAADGWLASVIWGTLSIVANGGAVVFAYRDLPLILPSARGVARTLVHGMPMFLFRTSAGFYGVANAVLLGLFCGPVSVTYFSAAERVVRASITALSPLSNALYPKIVSSLAEDPEQARRLCVKAFQLMTLGGIAIAVLLQALAGTLMRIALGDDFGPAETVLRIHSVVPLLSATANVLGILWMLPLRMDKPFLLIFASGGALSAGAATTVLARYQQVGMAVVTLGVELLVVAAMLMVLARRGQLPFAGVNPPAAVASQAAFRQQQPVAGERGIN